MAVEPEGYEGAPVLIAGWQAAPGESAPLEASPGSRVRELLKRYCVPMHLIRLTYVLRNAEPRVDPAKARQADAFFSEINIGGHQAVILLGMDAAKGVLRLCDQRIEDVRRTVFTWPGRTEARFFVTHGPDTLNPEKPIHVPTAEFWTDLRAVFDVNISYFNRNRIVKG